jgi:hypothetical protein
MLVPLYGFLEGDTMGLLVLAQEEDTLATVASKLRASASLRVHTEGAYDVLYRGERLDPRATVASVGLTALDRIDVRRSAPLQEHDVRRGGA